MTSPDCYRLSWVTDDLAIGGAPMSYDALDSIKTQGIDAVLNLCAEFCDLHEIEAQAGLEVRYLPIRDEEAPDPEALDSALDWLDEAVYLGKKVLIHCKHGIGRTGTVLTAYLIRCGFSPKGAAKRLAKVKAGPANFCQWWFLRSYSRKRPALTIRPPRLERSPLPGETAPQLALVEGVYEAVEARLAGLAVERCGDDHARCCVTPLLLPLAEAVYLHHHLNLVLTASEREAAIRRAVEADRARRQGEVALCPLSEEGECLLCDFRPLACRLWGLLCDFRPLACRLWGLPPDAGPVRLPGSLDPTARLEDISTDLSSAIGLKAPQPRLPIAQVVSGRFVQVLFDKLSGD